MSRGLRGKVIVLLLVAILSAALPAPALAKARTITVPIDYPDIQSALDSAAEGDSITVLKGVYKGFEVRKRVNIIGESSQAVVVAGSVTVWASNVKISSMKIVLENPSSGFASAVKILGSDVLLTNLVVESGSSGVQVGDPDHTDASASLEYVTIVAGKGEGYLGKPSGVWGACKSLLVYYSSITLLKEGTGVSGCGYTQLAFSTVASAGTGVRVVGGEVKNSSISGSQTGVAVSGDNVVVESNSVSSGGIGIDVFQSDGNTVSENTVNGLSTGIRVVGKNNAITRNRVSSGGSAIELRGDSNTIANNTLSGGRGVNGLYGYGNTIAFNFINMTGHIGIYMSKSTGGNLIYGNTFWYCYNYNAADESGGNQWYVESKDLRMGNYWYDHTSPDKNGDGIVDTPYAIDTTTGLQILDKYPLTSPAVKTASKTTTTTTPSTTPKTSTPYTSSPTKTSPPQSTTELTETSSTPSYSITLTAIPLAVVIAVILLVVLKRRR